MTTPTPQTIRRRLERAGFVHVSGWLPKPSAYAVEVLIHQHRPKVDEVMAEPPRPSGRPRKLAD